MSHTQKATSLVSIASKDNPLWKLVDAASRLQSPETTEAPPPVEAIEIENSSCSSQSIGDLNEEADFNDGKVVIGTREDLYRGANQRTTFAEQLMDIIDDEANSDVLVWMPDGEAFTIVNHRLFVMDRMQKLFKIQNMSSFVRKLNRWGFFRHHEKSTRNSDIFKHNLFRRGRRDLVKKIRCVPRPAQKQAQPAVIPPTAEEVGRRRVIEDKVYPVQFHREQGKSSYCLNRPAVTPPFTRTVSAMPQGDHPIHSQARPPFIPALSSGFPSSNRAMPTTCDPTTAAQIKESIISDMTSRVVSAALDTLRRDHMDVLAAHSGGMQQHVPSYPGNFGMSQRYDVEGRIPTAPSFSILSRSGSLGWPAGRAHFG